MPIFKVGEYESNYKVSHSKFNIYKKKISDRKKGDFVQQKKKEREYVKRKLLISCSTVSLSHVHFLATLLLVLN